VPAGHAPTQRAGGVCEFSRTEQCRHRFWRPEVGIWSVATGKQLTELREHKDVVLSARFSPDGRRSLLRPRTEPHKLGCRDGLKLADPSVTVIRSSRRASSRMEVGDNGIIGQNGEDLGSARSDTANTPWLPDLAEAVGGGD